MAEGTRYDTTDTGTLRPNVKPLQQIGTDFMPMELPEIDQEIHLLEYASPDDPITLFTLYYSPQMIDYIVYTTNEYPREPADPSRRHARAYS